VKLNIAARHHNFGLSLPEYNFKSWQEYSLPVPLMDSGSWPQN
jgi:hypothetical protein